MSSQFVERLSSTRWLGLSSQLDKCLQYPWFLRSGEVREFKSTRVQQKLTKMQKQFWTVVCQLR